MNKVYVLYSGTPSYKRILFIRRAVSWKRLFNWKIAIRRRVFIQLPFLRFCKFNGSFQIGIGNYYLEFGW